jgi:hypothetical protein
LEEEEDGEWVIEDHAKGGREPSKSEKLYVTGCNKKEKAEEISRPVGGYQAARCKQLRVLPEDGRIDRQTLCSWMKFLRRKKAAAVSASFVLSTIDRRFESPQGLGIFLFTTASRPALGPIQPPIQRVPGALSLG